MNNSFYYEFLSREERIRRIGAILGKAVNLRLAREHANNAGAGEVSTPSDESPPSGHEFSISDASAQSLTADELILLRKAAVLGCIRPHEATAFFGTSRTTTYRRMQDLKQRGWLVRREKGKASRYVLTDQARSVLKRLKRQMQK